MIERFPSYSRASQFAKELAVSENVIVRMQSGEDGFYYVATSGESGNLAYRWNEEWHQKNVASWRFARNYREPTDHEISNDDYYHRELKAEYFGPTGDCYFGQNKKT